MNKQVVVIGGGNGTAKAICALKRLGKTLDLAAVVSMSDSGGSSGRLRAELKALPPGDILRAILAMSGRYDYGMLKAIFHTARFSAAGKLQAHNLGNLFLALTAQYAGDFMAAVAALEQSVEAAGHVYPSTLDAVQLQAKLNDGSVVHGEAEIDRPSYDRSLRIVQVWLAPAAVATAEAKTAIRKADILCLGPGSLYTSLAAALLPEGISEAIKSSAAKIVYISPLYYDEKAETGPRRLSELVAQLQGYLPRKIDTVLYSEPAHGSPDLKKQRQEKLWTPNEFDAGNLPRYQLIKKPLEAADRVGTDDKLLSEALQAIIYGD